MANNRIFIRCRNCGEALFLGKTFWDGYYWNAYGGPPLEERLNKFYTEHTYCSKEKAKSVPYDEEVWPIEGGYENSDGAFEIVYEIGETINGNKRGITGWG